MSSDEANITYHDDGSEKRRAGSIIFLGLTMDGKLRASESRTNLADLKAAVLNMLAVCGDVEPSELCKKISYRMMELNSSQLLCGLVSDNLGFSEHVLENQFAIQIQHECLSVIIDELCKIKNYIGKRQNLLQSACEPNYIT